MQVCTYIQVCKYASIQVCKCETMHIWSNVMRTHIGLIICHFSPSILRVTGTKKTKLWRKTGPQCYQLYRWSILKYFIHYRVSQKWSKFWPTFLQFLKFKAFHRVILGFIGTKQSWFWRNISIGSNTKICRNIINTAFCYRVSQKLPKIQHF